jgi:hypothetical protein
MVIGPSSSRVDGRVVGMGMGIPLVVVVVAAGWS